MLDTEEEMINEQSAIGWDGILEGFIGSHWAIKQERYYILLGKKQQDYNGPNSLYGGYGKLHGTCGPTETNLNMRRKRNDRTQRYGRN
jgi:hypothetical protein